MGHAKLVLDELVGLTNVTSERGWRKGLDDG
jgi:hypothetical protein